MTITELHGRMTEVLAGCETDAVKLQNGNMAAGVRVRKALKELKDLAVRAKKVSLGKPGDEDCSPGVCESRESCDSAGHSGGETAPE